MAGFDPFQNLNLNKFFGLPNYDQMLTQKAMDDAKKKESSKKPKLLGGDNSVMKAAPPKAVMKAAPKELLGGPDAKIEPGWQEQWKNQRDANTKAVFGPIQDAFNNVVLGDWYDPDHQTVAYKALHPKVDPADAAIKGNVINKMVLQNQPNPQPAKAVATQEQVATGKPVSVPANANTKGAAIPVAQQQVPANQNQTGKQVNIPANADQKGSFVPVATDPQTGAELHVDPQTGGAVINDKQTGTVVPVSNAALQPSLQSAATSQETPSAPVQPETKSSILENPVEAQQKVIQERDALTEQSRPMIMKALGLDDTDENWFRLKNNFIPPSKPWSVEHPIAAMVAQMLVGLSQAGFASINSNNLAGNIATGLGRGTTNGINSITAGRDAYNQQMDQFRQGAAAGLERGRVYSDVPGLGLNTSLTAGELESRAGRADARKNQYNKDIADYNESIILNGGKVRPGDPVGTYGGQVLGKRGELEEARKATIAEEERLQAKDDQISQRLAAINEYAQTNPGKPVPSSMFAGIPYERLKGYLDPATMASIQNVQANAAKDKYELDRKQALEQYVQDPNNWTDIINHAREIYGDAGANIIYNAAQSGDPKVVLDAINNLDANANKQASTKIQQERNEIYKSKASKNNRDRRSQRRGGSSGDSQGLSPEQQKQSQGIYPGRG